ncbi:hypothetical protein ACWCRF_32510 [Streptomyces sp. NPDC002405]
MGHTAASLRDLARNSFEAPFLDDDETRRARCPAEVGAYDFETAGAE